MGSGKTTGLRSILLLRWRLVSRTGEALCTSLRFLGRETPPGFTPLWEKRRARRPGLVLASEEAQAWDSGTERFPFN